MRKLSFFVLFFVVAACSTESSEEGSALQNHISKKIFPASIGVSNTSNFTSAISQLELSSEGQNLLTTLLNEILKLKKEGATYEEVHAYLVDFQNKVMASNISSNEKEAILPSLSVVQYDFYASTEADGGRKDRDWELSVGNFKVTGNSTTESTSDTIVNTDVSETLN